MIGENGALTDADFPIPVRVQATRRRMLDGIWGPVPVFRVSFNFHGLPQCRKTIRVCGCDVLVARHFVNGGEGFWLGVMGQLSLGANYEVVV